MERRVWSAAIAALLVKMLVTASSLYWLASGTSRRVRERWRGLMPVNLFFVLVNPSFRCAHLGLKWLTEFKRN
jgi:hypothetical protein